MSNSTFPTFLNRPIASTAAPETYVIPDQATVQQAEFICALRDDNDSLMLEAVAGSGKTWTLTQALLASAARYSTGALACAFNKRIADELARKLPPTVTCKTMNGLGHGAWQRHVGRRLNINQKKFWDCGKLLGREVADLLWEFPEIKRIVDLARTAGLIPKGAPALTPSSADHWDELVEDMNLAADAAYISETAQSILVEMIKRAFDGEIDFNDQLYMPIIYKANFPKYNLVVVDEFQDLALLQHEMIARLLAPGGRVVGAGDRNQAIYAFRGALYDSIDRAATRFKMRRLPLTVSFRCPKLVVQECRAEVPHMESAEEASEGTIIHKAKLAAIRPGDFVVCRYNKHLVKLCFRLLARGIPATIMGREIGQSLKRIVKKFESLDIMAFMTALAQWRDIEVMNAIGKGDEARADTIRDQAEAIEIIREGRNCQTPAGIISAIDAMFTDEQNGMITLGTIHKMKGLENKRVHFLAHDLVPPPWRKDRLSQGELQQERNMRYVAKSRAQDTLTYIASAELEAPPETEPPSARPSNDQLTQTLKEI